MRDDFAILFPAGKERIYSTRHVPLYKKITIFKQPAGLFSKSNRQFSSRTLYLNKI